MPDEASSETSLAAVGGIFVFCVLGMASSGALLSGVAGIAGVAAAQAVFFGAAPLLLGRLAGLDPGTTAPFALRLRFIPPVLLAVPAAVAAAVYFEGFEEIYVVRYQEDLLGAYRDMFDPSRTHPAVVFAAVAVVPAVCEEILFRGFLQGALGRRMPAALAAVVSAALFSLTHFPVEIMPPIFLLGLMLSILRIVTGSLAAPIAAHLLNNSLAVGFAWGSLGPIGDLMAYGHGRFAVSAAAFALPCAAAWALGRTGQAGGGTGGESPSK